MDFLLASAEAASEAAGSSSLIAVDWRTLLFAILNITLLFVVLRTFLMKPVQNMLDERKKAATAVMDEAKKLQNEAQSQLSVIERQKQQALEDSRKLTSESVQNAEAIKEEIVTKAKDDAKSIIRLAEEEAKGEREMAEQDLKNRSKKIISASSKQVLSQVFDKDLSEVYAQHVIAELPKLTACDIDSKKINLCDALRSGGKVDKIRLEVASDLSDDKKKQIKDFVHGLVSSKPEILYTIKPELIAGFKLFIGDTVFDATLSRTVDTSVSNLR